MRPLARSLVAAAALLLAAGPAGAQVSVARFRDDRRGAMSFTFDDGSRAQYDVAIPMLNALGLKGSFYVIAGYTRETPWQPCVVDTWDNWGEVTWMEWRRAAAAGHEIGSHSLTHPLLPRCTPAELEREVAESQQVIARELGKKPLTFVYPFNGRSAAVRAVVMTRFCAARERETKYGGPGFGLPEANAVADAAIARRGWAVPMIHGIGEEWAPLGSEVFNAHLRYCRALVDQGLLWVDTFANVSRYGRERDAATIAVEAQSETRVRFTASVPLDPAVFDVPLTFVVATGVGAPARVSALREGSDAPLPVSTSGGEILVEALPGPGAITVAWTLEGTNEAPFVTAGAAQDARPREPVRLAGTIVDATVPWGILAAHWEQLSGPAPASFEDSAAPATVAEFPAEGDYLLRLVADDGELVAADSVRVHVAQLAAKVAAHGRP